MKKLSALFLFAFILSISLVPAASAYKGASAAVVSTTDKHYGINATFTIPSNVFVSNDGSYINFYVGLATYCEGGLSYKPSTGWNTFLNCGSTDPFNESVPLAVQPAAGSKYTLKLVNNAHDSEQNIVVNNVSYPTATLYVFNSSGTIVKTLKMPCNRGLTSTTTVKMVHAMIDHTDKLKYSNAAFSNVLLRKTSDGYTYTAFPTTLQPVYKRSPDDKTWTTVKDPSTLDFTIHTKNPLKTSVANKL